MPGNHHFLRPTASPLWQRLSDQHNIAVLPAKSATHGKPWQASYTVPARGRGRFTTGDTIESAGGETEEDAVFSLVQKLKLKGWQNVPAKKK